MDRFDIQGLQDPGKAEKNGIVKKGISGYSSKFLGWILAKIFHKAVRVGDVYLNCSSLAQYLGRVKAPYSKEKLEKISHSAKHVEKVIERLLKPKQVTPTLPQVVVETEEEIEEVQELPIIAQKNEAPAFAMVKTFLDGFNDDRLLGDKFEEMQKIFQDFQQFIIDREIKVIFINTRPLKAPKEKKYETPVNYFAWVTPDEEKPLLKLDFNTVEIYNETPNAKLKRLKILKCAQQMAALLASMNQVTPQEEVD